MKQAIIFCTFLSILFQAGVALATPESYDLTNAQPTVRKGWVLYLADGRKIDPWTTRPEGWIAIDEDSLLTGEGLIIRRDGSIEYPFATEPSSLPRSREGDLVTQEGFTLVPLEKEKPATATIPANPVRRLPNSAPPKQKPIAEAPKKEDKQQLWTMLPLSDVEDNKKKKGSSPARKAETKKGDNLRIPADAPKTGDLSFLEGCWVSDRITGGTWNDPRKAKTTSVCTMCFNKQGKGQLTVSSGSLRCRGAARARFSGRSLKIDSDNAKCPPNPANITYFTYRDWQCTGTSRSTQCFLLSINPHKRQEVSKFKTRLRKK